MSFKEQILKDLDAVFLNLKEFGETHRIEGREVPVVVDSDRLEQLKKGNVLGLVEADMLLMGKESDFPPDLTPGSLLNVDGREMIVANYRKDMGMVEVALNQNRTG